MLKVICSFDSCYLSLTTLLAKDVIILAITSILFSIVLTNIARFAAVIISTVVYILD